MWIGGYSSLLRCTGGRDTAQREGNAPVDADLLESGLFQTSDFWDPYFREHKTLIPTNLMVEEVMSIFRLTRDPDEKPWMSPKVNDLEMDVMMLSAMSRIKDGITNGPTRALLCELIFNVWDTLLDRQMTRCALSLRQQLFIAVVPPSNDHNLHKIVAYADFVLDHPSLEQWDKCVILMKAESEGERKQTNADLLKFMGCVLSERQARGKEAAPVYGVGFDGLHFDFHQISLDRCWSTKTLEAAGGHSPEVLNLLGHIIMEAIIRPSSQTHDTDPEESARIDTCTVNLVAP